MSRHTKTLSSCDYCGAHIVSSTGRYVRNAAGERSLTFACKLECADTLETLIREQADAAGTVRTVRIRL